MRPRVKLMQSVHECICGSVMKQGPGKYPEYLLQCNKCSFTLSIAERHELLRAAYFLGEKHRREGKPFEPNSIFGPYFKGRYRRGYEGKDIDFEI